MLQLCLKLMFVNLALSLSLFAGDHLVRDFHTAQNAEDSVSRLNQFLKIVDPEKPASVKAAGVVVADVLVAGPKQVEDLRRALQLFLSKEEGSLKHSEIVRALLQELTTRFMENADERLLNELMNLLPGLINFSADRPTLEAINSILKQLKVQLGSIQAGGKDFSASKAELKKLTLFRPLKNGAHLVKAVGLAARGTARETAADVKGLLTPEMGRDALQLALGVSKYVQPGATHAAAQGAFDLAFGQGVSEAQRELARQLEADPEIRQQFEEFLAQRANTEDRGRPSEVAANPFFSPSSGSPWRR